MSPVTAGDSGGWASSVIATGFPKQRGGIAPPPAADRWRRPSMGERRTATPDVDAGEQEQPDHVDEVPVPGGELEAEVLLRGELAGIGAREADDQEDRADDHVRAVEAGRHEEGRAVDVARVVERGVTVLEGLHAGEQCAERDRADQAPL